MIHPHDSSIVRTMSRMLIPLIQLFALYVLFFGQYGPGGGFVGGVMLRALGTVDFSLAQSNEKMASQIYTLQFYSSDSNYAARHKNL